MVDLETLVDEIARLAAVPRRVRERPPVRAHLELRAETRLGSVEARRVRVGAIHPKVRAVRGRDAIFRVVGDAKRPLQRSESVLQPGLPDVFELAALETEHVLPEERMVRREREPVRPAASQIARVVADGEAGDVVDDAVTELVLDVSNDQLGSLSEFARVVRGERRRNSRETGEQDDAGKNRISHVHLAPPGACAVAIGPGQDGTLRSMEPTERWCECQRSSLLDSRRERSLLGISDSRYQTRKAGPNGSNRGMHASVSCACRRFRLPNRPDRRYRGSAPSRLRVFSIRGPLPEPGSDEDPRHARRNGAPRPR